MASNEINTVTLSVSSYNSVKNDAENTGYEVRR